MRQGRTPMYPINIILKRSCEGFPLSAPLPIPTPQAVGHVSPPACKWPHSDQECVDLRRTEHHWSSYHFCLEAEALHLWAAHTKVQAWHVLKQHTARHETPACSSYGSPPTSRKLLQDCPILKQDRGFNQQQHSVQTPRCIRLIEN